MKFTILGSSGFIGSHLAAFLQKQGYECFLPAKDHVFSKNENLGHVIYAIGLTSDFRKKPMETVKAHVCKLVEVVENSIFESFLYLSSTRIYNGNENGNETTTFFVNPADFSDLYNISKLMGESICLSISNEKVRVARISNVIGNDFNSDNFLFSLIRGAVDKQEIKLEVSAEASKDYICIDDVINLIQLIALKGKSRIYNISSGQSLSNGQLLEEIKKNTNCKIEFLNSLDSLLFPIIQNEKIKNEFSYVPKNILTEIKILIKNYKEKKYDKY